MNTIGNANTIPRIHVKAMVVSNIFRFWKGDFDSFLKLSDLYRSKLIAIKDCDDVTSEAVKLKKVDLQIIL